MARGGRLGLSKAWRSLALILIVRFPRRSLWLKKTTTYQEIVKIRKLDFLVICIYVKKYSPQVYKSCQQWWALPPNTKLIIKRRFKSRHWNENIFQYDEGAYDFERRQEWKSHQVLPSITPRLKGWDLRACPNIIRTEGALSMALTRDFLPIPIPPLHIAFGATSVSTSPS